MLTREGKRNPDEVALVKEVAHQLFIGMQSCVLRCTAETRFLGGAETVSPFITSMGRDSSSHALQNYHTLTYFVACMLLHPVAQRRAQEEIDCVVGHARLPDFGDRESLPFVDCVVKEIMRRVTV